MKLPPKRSGCPLSTTLEAIGDRWSLLIVRDLMFKSRKTFKDFLDGGEGIATNILADRLHRLEAQGIIGRVRDSGDARKIIYRLTPKGLDLAPALVEMIIWAARYHETDAPRSAIREMTQNRERFIADIRKRWEATQRTPSSASPRASGRSSPR